MPRRLLSPRATAFALLGSALVAFALSGCARQVAPPEPDAKVRLKKLFALYKYYGEKNRKGPPNEQALRDFGQKLTAKERDEQMIGEDLDTIFTSPRDNQKYTVVWNLRIDPATNRAVAWEATGKDGMRYVALTIGYVEEYDEETFKEYKK